MGLLAIMVKLLFLDERRVLLTVQICARGDGGARVKRKCLQILGRVLFCGIIARRLEGGKLVARGHLALQVQLLGLAHRNRLVEVAGVTCRWLGVLGRLRLQVADLLKLLLPQQVVTLKLDHGLLALEHDLNLLVVHQPLLDFVVVVHALGLGSWLATEVRRVRVRLRLEIHLYLLCGVPALRIDFWSLLEAWLWLLCRLSRRYSRVTKQELLLDAAATQENHVVSVGYSRRFCIFCVRSSLLSMSIINRSAS
jgi:hypothetical protein